MTERKITLEQMLRARDLRHRHQVDLLGQFRDMALLQITVVMPGEVKRNDLSAVIAKAAVEAVREAFGDRIRMFETNDADTGFEAFAVIDMPCAEVKRIASAIEDSHPLGRLMDLDVITEGPAPMSRKETGTSPRRCLICEKEARLCMRERNHTPEEIENRIRQMVTDYGAGL